MNNFVSEYVVTTELIQMLSIQNYSELFINSELLIQNNSDDIKSELIQIFFSADECRVGCPYLSAAANLKIKGIYKIQIITTKCPLVHRKRNFQT